MMSVYVFPAAAGTPPLREQIGALSEQLTAQSQQISALSAKLSRVAVDVRAGLKANL